MNEQQVTFCNSAYSQPVMKNTNPCAHVSLQTLTQTRLWFAAPVCTKRSFFSQLKPNRLTILLTLLSDGVTG